MTPLQSFPIKASQKCKFSNGGNIFAVGSQNAIFIINSYTGNVLFETRVHTNKITSLFFTPCDYYLISTGLDGAVYRWDLTVIEHLNHRICPEKVNMFKNL